MSEPTDGWLKHIPPPQPTLDVEGEIEPRFYKRMQHHIQLNWTPLPGNGKPIYPLQLDECYAVKIDGRWKRFRVTIAEDKSISPVSPRNSKAKCRRNPTHRRSKHRRPAPAQKADRGSAPRTLRDRSSSRSKTGRPTKSNAPANETPRPTRL